jgi:hypothetical protein
MKPVGERRSGIRTLHSMSGDGKRGAAAAPVLNSISNHQHGGRL